VTGSIELTAYNIACDTMLFRFAILQKDKRSQSGQGLFHAAESLRANKQLAEDEDALVREIFDWFNRKLPHPTRFARAARPHAECKGISWFKDTAEGFISRMEELAVVLAEHGHVVERLTTERPGYVVYEDQYQVVAEPFR
jgi:hypothetical protein